MGDYTTDFQFSTESPELTTSPGLTTRFQTTSVISEQETATVTPISTSSETAENETNPENIDISSTSPSITSTEAEAQTETLNFDLGIEISSSDAERIPELDFSNTTDPVVSMITEYVNNLLENLLEDHPNLVVQEVLIIGIEKSNRRKRDTMQVSFHGFILQIQIVVENKESGS